MFGRGSLSVAVLGVAACRTTGGSDPDSTTTQTPPTSVPVETTTTAPGTTTSSAPPTDEPTREWARVDLGFVSAYVIVRAGEAAVIDTGTQGSADAIEAVLSQLGSRWEDLSHVILTHSHGDHIGSLDAVLTSASAAVAYAGAADIPAISSPRPVGAVDDGDSVFDLQVIATPGHTPGHISLLDPTLRVLFAGDAINGDNGNVAGPNPQFTPDMDTAFRSVEVLAALDYDAILFGHGEPATEDAVAQVAALTG